MCIELIGAHFLCFLLLYLLGIAIAIYIEPALVGVHISTSSPLVSW